MAAVTASLGPLRDDYVGTHCKDTAGLRQAMDLADYECIVCLNPRN